MSKYTKGKWKVSGLYVISKQNEEDYIRICQNLSSDADARLIAAAPNLLEACEITKNRLLTHGEWDDGCFYYAGSSASELEEPLKLLKTAIAKAKKE